jgi:response regulator RpfG family c-di-GMP phosphodiesterase
VAIIGKWDRAKISAKVDEVHNQVNGMKTELVAKAGALGEALGNRRGRAEVLDEIQRSEPSVIILEDNDDDLFIMNSMLIKTGVKKTRSYQITAKFRAELTNDVNVYVIDDNLGGGQTGLIAVEEVLRMNENSFLILCTGNQDLQILAKYDNLGVDRFLYKNDTDYELLFKRYISEGIRLAKLRK